MAGRGDRQDAGETETATAGEKALDKGDYATALKEWRLAAAQGDADAQYGLGVIYKHARGVPQDYEQALHWYSLAAEQGQASAQTNLGEMYDNGLGVPQDHTEAVRWFRRAAEQGNAIAQFSLGIMYATGRGVQEDYVQAYLWFTRAAAQGHSSAGKFRDTVLAEDMTPAQLAEAQRLAREWKAKGK